VDIASLATLHLSQVQESYRVVLMVDQRKQEKKFLAVASMANVRH
jgi:hypothetical protein